MKIGISKIAEAIAMARQKPSHSVSKKATPAKSTVDTEMLVWIRVLARLRFSVGKHSMIHTMTEDSREYAAPP